MKIKDYLDRMRESLDVYSWVFKNTVPKISRKHLKLIRKIVNISQASSGTTATATSKEAGSDSFKIAKAVQVSYKMW